MRCKPCPVVAIGQDVAADERVVGLFSTAQLVLLTDVTQFLDAAGVERDFVFLSDFRDRRIHGFGAYGRLFVAQGAADGAVDQVDEVADQTARGFDEPPWITSDSRCH